MGEGRVVVSGVYPIGKLETVLPQIENWGGFIFCKIMNSFQTDQCYGETAKDSAIVPMECEYETVPKL